MRTYFILLIVALFSIHVNAENNILVLRLNSGAPQLYNIHEPITIQTSSDSLYVKSEHIEAVYSRNNVKGYSFTTDGAIDDGIVSPTVSTASALKINREGDIISLKGLCDNARIRVFSTNGIEVSPNISYTKEVAIINMNTLTPGVYLVHISGCKDIPGIKITK